MPDARIALRVQPRARLNSVAVSEAGAVVVRVTAVPDRGRANAAVIEVLARALHLPPSAIEIARGHSSRSKVVKVAGLTEEAAMERLRG